MIFGSILNNLRNLLPSSEGYFGRIYSILNKIVLVTLALAAIAWYKFDYIASLLINNHDIKIAVEKILFESTGKKAVVEGDVVFITTPEPEIVVKKINIQNPVGAFKESYAQIDTLKTNPDLLSLVFGNISFDRIYLENVILNNQENSSSVNEGSGFDLKNNFYIVSDKNVKIKNIAGQERPVQSHHQEMKDREIPVQHTGPVNARRRKNRHRQRSNGRNQHQ